MLELEANDISKTDKVKYNSVNIYDKPDELRNDSINNISYI